MAKHWYGSGDFNTVNGSTVYFSGHNTKSYNGEATVIPKRLNSAVMEYWPINDRIMYIKLNSSLCKLNKIQLYALTSKAPDEEIDEFYCYLEQMFNSIPNEEISLVQVNFNKKISDTTLDDDTRRSVGSFVQGTSNDRRK